MNKYDETKLMIYESYQNGDIDEDTKYDLLNVLEDAREVADKNNIDMQKKKGNLK